MHSLPGMKICFMVIVFIVLTLDIRLQIAGIIKVIQVDIGGHPPFPTDSKQFSGNFGNLLFLASFNFWGHFEGLNEGFLG